MNDELMNEIKGMLPWLIVAALVVGGWYGWKHYSAARKVAASEAVVNAFTVEELEEAASKYASTDAGGALKLRLAKKYFDGERYQQALDIYDELAKNPPEGFADVPAVGRAQCLEAMGQYAEAQKAFEAFVQANPKSFLKLTAQLGAARSLAQAGDKKAALEQLAALKESVKDDTLAKMRVEATEDVVTRCKK